MAEGPPRDEFYVSDKEDGFMYKWVNSRERVVLLRSRQGYEVVTKPEELPEAVRLVNPPVEGQSASSTVRRRGDVVLMRIRRDVWERNVNGPIQATRERHRITAESMLASANDAARRALRARGIPDSQIPRELITLDHSPERLKNTE